MRQGGFRSGRTVAGRLDWRSLQVRLAAAVFCLVAAGAGIIGAASHLAAQGYLLRRADQQLRSYAGVLTSRPFTLFPGFPVAPGAASPGRAGRSVSIEVRDSGGQLLVSAGTVTPPASGGSWLKITEPIRYQARHIPFVYGAEDSSFYITGETGTGLAGTLVVGLDLAGVGRAVNTLTLTCLAVSGAALLLLACATAGVIHILLRPLGRMAQTAAAVGSGDLSRRVPVARAQGDVGNLARTLNRALDQAELALTTAASSDAAARESSERMRQAVAGAGDRLRRPLSVLAGLAGAYRERGGFGAGDPDRTIRRMANEAARMDAVLENLLSSPASAGAPPSTCAPRSTRGSTRALQRGDRCPGPAETIGRPRADGPG
jgi:two-component system OmpR family sensor kinase